MLSTQLEMTKKTSIHFNLVCCWAVKHWFGWTHSV